MKAATSMRAWRNSRKGSARARLRMIFIVSRLAEPEVVDIRDYGQNYIEQYKRGEFETVMAAVRRERVLQAIGGFPHRTILEVGCGFEPLFPHVREFDEYWIVEPLPEAVAAARSAGDGR